ncbi:MAG TPA: tRNA (adenosine(37)-N6)-threonylcarbamoyltransferase complex transferase subunit TsaD [Verrucomicrobia bacterium]|nr:tRNA (adenosine(37)-N6)-threonylcarbamoyltransferase complex transferase subunit TsaD [Verrucomicrobiota bacterium]HCG19815.1 tRNA (adenosine(37)-N6)-threonylcarbamoyltransferase complex transferase subunit TsaD [Verrucomicrobiota bacterium]
MNILGIETSCDETAAAVVKDGVEVVSNVVYTQIPLHRPYGGVVPEIASRAHIEKIPEVVGAAIKQFAARRPGERVDAVAVTYGPGLSPALIVGLNAAKGLALSLGVPLIGVNHIEAHLHTPFLYEESVEGAPQVPGLSPMGAVPALGLAVSGGHTNWIDLGSYGNYETIGQTLDDAAGEAFDKASKLLGLGYPGGPKLDKISREYLATHGKTNLVPFPKGRPREGVTALAGLPAELCVSFSGLKTALLHYVQTAGGAAKLSETGEIPRVVASYQEAIVQAIADRTRTALKRKRYKSFIVGGGVSLNSRLRTVLADVAAQAGVPLLLAKPKFCGDNGAMIAGLAYFRRKYTGEAALALDVAPSLEVG